MIKYTTGNSSAYEYPRSSAQLRQEGRIIPSITNFVTDMAAEIIVLSCG
ncbi:MAG: hypothetical protein ACRD8W_26155 [Nitrososphaeraceae archaeon]